MWTLPISGRFSVRRPGRLDDKCGLEHLPGCLPGDWAAEQVFLNENEFFSFQRCKE